MLDRAVNVLDLVNGCIPDQRGAFNQLPLDVLGGLVGGPSGLEGNATAARVGGEADGVGVGNLRDDVLYSEAQHLGEHLGDCRARASDVHGAFHQAYPAIGQHVGDDARWACVVPAETHSDAPTSKLAFNLHNGSVIVRMFLDSVHDLLGSDRPVYHAVGAPSALGGGVQQS